MTSRQIEIVRVLAIPCTATHLLHFVYPKHQYINYFSRAKDAE